MSEAIYRKVQRGKRVHYELVGNAAACGMGCDVLKPGQFRLEFASMNGLRRYSYPVAADTIGWEDAALLARDAMEAAMHKMATASPQMGNTPYTKKQMAIIERYRTEMAAAGGMFPSWWQHKAPREIAQAAIDAVRVYRP